MTMHTTTTQQVITFVLSVILVLLSHIAAAAAAATYRFEQQQQQLLLTPPLENQHALPPKDTSSSTLDHHHHHSGFVAFGDSYGAGIGTGALDDDDGQGEEEEEEEEEVGEKESACRRGAHAYAELIAHDLRPEAFQFLSCTGAVTTDVLAGDGDGDGGGGVSQIGRFNASLPTDFALLSIGGNDLGFFDVINACVFRFYTFYSGGCADALARSRALLESDEFEDHTRAVIRGIIEKARSSKSEGHEKKKKGKKKTNRFTVTVTGYARFFNEVTDECDDVSFGVWWDGWDGPKLTKALRAEMNALVLAVNAKLRRTVETINANAGLMLDREEEEEEEEDDDDEKEEGKKGVAFFVDYDRAFDGHRFCEPDVTEPDHERAGTWFFFIGGPDNGKNGTQPQRGPDVETLPAEGSPLTDPSSCLGPARKSGDWGMLALCYMAMAKHRDSTLRPAWGGVVPSSSTWYVPTYYGKTFHPRSRGHEAIRDSIYETWRGFKGERP